MAFFDKLSKTVTEVSQKTIAKAKELADTSRLNSMISEEKRLSPISIFRLANCTSPSTKTILRMILLE